MKKQSTPLPLEKAQKQKTKNKIRLGMFGAGGRIGQEILLLLQQNEMFESSIGICKSGKTTGYQVSAAKALASHSKLADVWVDFSSPGGFSEVLKFCVEYKLPLVSGTTGFSAKEKKMLAEASGKIPILWASNMSLGIAILRKAMTALSNLNGFDFQIEEFHHRHKKDRPSGTALTLQEDLEGIVKAKLPTPLSIRGGGIFGIHKVYAMSNEEVINFEHTALNRSVFAKGALSAAKWIVDKSPGLYSMADIFKT